MRLMTVQLGVSHSVSLINLAPDVNDHVAV